MNEPSQTSIDSAEFWILQIYSSPFSMVIGKAIKATTNVERFPVTVGCINNFLSILSILENLPMVRVLFQLCTNVG